MIVEYTQADGSMKVFGYLMPDGPTSTATGRIHKGYHHKCFHALRKRESRGDAVTGRVLQGVPTGYEIGGMILSRDEIDALGLTPEQVTQLGTAGLTTRLDRLRAVAQRIGKGVGDATVLEALWAQENGTPYRHTHHLRLEFYQLRAHLEYAHGIDPQDVPRAGRGLHRFHDELHHTSAAIEALTRHREARASDPGFTEPTETDWREQLSLPLTDLIQETHLPS